LTFSVSENPLPRIGILCWEGGGSTPQGLEQLESLKGNSTNPETFSFPVLYKRVPGANIETILEHPDSQVMERMIAEARAMEDAGIRAITTSCGFNAIFQNKIAAALRVPFFSSSLLQVPLIRQMLGPNRSILVLTAKKAALREEHLREVGIAPETNLHIYGMEECPEWGKIFTAPREDVDLKVIAREVVATGERAYEEHPDAGALVLECTDLPPFAAALRERTRLPVFDFVTLTEYIHRALC
jgi:hypothetical protein